MAFIFYILIGAVGVWVGWWLAVRGKKEGYKKTEEGKKKVMGLFNNKNKITNKDVEKLLGVSDASATRYLDKLEKEEKIKQVGSTGKYTYYTKH